MDDMGKAVESVKDIGQLGANSLKKILRSTMESIEENKAQIFHIHEAVRKEVESSKKKLDEIRRMANQTMDEVDALEKVEQREKQNLVRVSRNFSEYSEERIKESYEAVKNVQIELGIAREKERQLRDRRDQLELRLRGLRETLRSAERLTICIGSVLGYLSLHLNGVVWQLKSARKNRFLGIQLIKAQEEERFRISREIHDGPAQDMATMSFQTAIIERLIDMDTEEAKRATQELRRQIGDCLKDVRQIIFDMRPMSLDDLGLVPALRQLVRKLHDREMLAATLEVDGEETNLPKHVEVGIFRIVQEALNNVRKHAGTKEAQVRMRFAEAALSVLVQDKGKGFAIQDGEIIDPDREEDEEQHGHYGILGMKERARIIGAELKVFSSLGSGTKVHLRLPMDHDAEGKHRGK